MDEGAWLKKIKRMKKFDENLTNPCKNDRSSVEHWIFKNWYLAKKVFTRCLKFENQAR